MDQLINVTKLFLKKSLPIEVWIGTIKETFNSVEKSDLQPFIDSISNNEVTFELKIIELLFGIGTTLDKKQQKYLVLNSQEVDKTDLQMKIYEGALLNERNNQVELQRITEQ